MAAGRHHWPPDSKRTVDVRAGQETGEVDFTVAPLQATGPATVQEFMRLTRMNAV
jgi:hypothetical protein